MLPPRVRDVVKTEIFERLPESWKRRYRAAHFAFRYLLPNTIYIETTSACNLNCVMCAAQRPVTKRFKPSGDMAPELFKSLVDEIASDLPSIDSVYLHKDGEPLLHPQIVELVTYASERLPNVTLVTNATLLDERMSRAILDTPLHRIRFSVDGFNRSTFDKVRIQRHDNEFRNSGIAVDFNAVIANVERFLELRRASANKTLNTGIRTTSFRATESEIDAYVSYWRKRVDFVDVAELSSWSGEVGPQTNGEARHACMAPWASLVISWEGHLVPCCTYVDTHGDRAGDLFDVGKNSLVRALKAPARGALMRAHLDGNLETIAPYCVDCRDWRSIPIPIENIEQTKAKLRTVAETSFTV